MPHFSPVWLGAQIRLYHSNISGALPYLRTQGLGPPSSIRALLEFRSAHGRLSWRFLLCDYFCQTLLLLSSLQSSQ